jgi:Domain of unknown function (DUF4395)
MSAVVSPPSRFSFPNPVNEVAARLVAAGVLVMALAVALLGQTWILVPMAYGFVARVAAGPRYSPLGLLVTRVAVPRLGIAPHNVPGPPKRFAQGMGAVLSVAAVVAAFGVGETGIARVLAGGIVVAATLESVFALCIGCKIFAGLMRVGVVPERICLECADLGARRT